jgi:hypothetical protein
VIRVPDQTGVVSSTKVLLAYFDCCSMIAILSQIEVVQQQAVVEQVPLEEVI